MRETAVRKQLSVFLGGKQVSKTGVWIWFWETGVGKQVPGYGSRKQVFGYGLGK